jgi:hypothetical protein
MARAMWLIWMAVCGMATCMPLAASAADEGRVNFLEQEVRRLQQQVMAMSRRIDQLERPALPTPGAQPRAQAPAPSSGAWIDAGKWKKLRTGMSELEVVSLLGAPTSMREADGARVLFYALEIGTSGFLGGSVTFRDRLVAGVQQPTLQ